MSEIDQDQDCYREGLFARALGRSCACNPYPESSREASLWIHGWWMVGADPDRQSEPSTAVAKVSVPVELADAIRDAPAERSRRSATANAFAKGMLLAGAVFSLSYLILRLLAY